MRHDVHGSDLRLLQDWTDQASGLEPAETEAADCAIGQLCDEFGVTPRALRFYESRALLRPRREGAVRTYSRDDRNRLALILKGKKLGFTLSEIAKLIESRETLDSDCTFFLSREQCIEQINRLERQKRDIEHALSELRRTYSSHYIRALANGGRRPG